MTFSTRQIVGFGAGCTAVMLALIALPSPYPEQVRVDPRTGAPILTDAHRFEELRRTGDARAVRDAIADDPRAPADWDRVLALLDAELAPVALDDLEGGDAPLAIVAQLRAALDEPDTGRRTESLFYGIGDLPGSRIGVDGRADALRRQLDNRGSDAADACRRLAHAFLNAGR